jgi:hypothetical protein
MNYCIWIHLEDVLESWPPDVMICNQEVVFFRFVVEWKHKVWYTPFWHSAWLAKCQWKLLLKRVVWTEKIQEKKMHFATRMDKRMWEIVAHTSLKSSIHPRKVVLIVAGRSTYSEGSLALTRGSVGYLHWARAKGMSEEDIRPCTSEPLVPALRLYPLHLNGALRQWMRRFGGASTYAIGITVRNGCQL